MKEKTQFIVDKDKCIGCGRCVNVCAGMVPEQAADAFIARGGRIPAPIQSLKN